MSSYDVLKIRQALSLDLKEMLTEKAIRAFHNHVHGAVYVSVSGKDSRVVLDKVRKIYPTTPAVFVNTGLEYPEIVSFWRNFENVIEIKPSRSFKQVVDYYGFPVISKQVSMGVSRYRNTSSDEQRELRLHGGVNPTSGKKQYRTIPVKYHHLVDAPFKISEQCCVVMKERPLVNFHKASGLHPITGEMANDSRNRQEQYIKHGCNAFSRSIPKSTPLGVWVEEDIWAYIKKENLDYPSVYDLGYDRTGCMFCMFGIMQESAKGLNRFQRMKTTHPKQYSYCINQLGLGDVLDYLGVDHD